MLGNELIRKLGSEPKTALVNTILVANAFIWYLCAFRFLQEAASLSGMSQMPLLAIITVNFLAVIVSALIGTLFIDKFKNRITFLKYWMLVGVVLSTLFLALNLTNFVSLVLIGGILGAYFGSGIPVCMGYFAATTQPENRARLGGIIILLIGLGFPIAATIAGDSAFLNSSILMLLRFSGLILIFFLKPPEKAIGISEKVSYRSILFNKNFLLYLIPWLMFSLVNDLTMQTNTNYFSNTSIFPSNLANNFLIIENILAGASAIVCGFLADKKGRKRLALVGFALLGIGYAALGLFTNNPLAAWFYVCVDGIAWGAFSMIFIVTIWGDIAQEKSSEKYYFIGFLPYLVSNFTRFSIGTYVLSISNGEGAIFSFASFFLFVAILPLVYAPETLSDRIMKSLDLNNYVNKAIEVVKKESHKGKKKQSTEDSQENIDEQEAEASFEDEEARKLAEKYY